MCRVHGRYVVGDEAGDGSASPEAAVATFRIWVTVPGQWEARVQSSEQGSQGPQHKGLKWK